MFGRTKPPPAVPLDQPQPGPLPAPAMPDEVDERPAMARGPGPMGKLIDNLTVWLDADTAMLFRRIAEEEVGSADRMLKNFIYSECYGKTYTQLEEEHRAGEELRREKSRAERLAARAMPTPRERVTNAGGTQG